jgi:hypothetical protein
MSDSWPEQDAIDSWFKAHDLVFRNEQLLVLKEEVTKPRIEVQKQCDYFEQSHLMVLEEINQVRSQLQQSQRREKELREALLEAADIFENRTNFLERAEKLRAIAGEEK